MIELQSIVESARAYETSPLPLEIKDISETDISVSGTQGHVLAPTELNGIVALTAYFFRRLLRLHTHEQREAADLFIKAMHDAHENQKAVDKILEKHKIRRRRPVTARKVLEAYREFVLLEQTSYEFVDDGKGVNHKELRFMHALVLKLKTFFR